MKALFLVLLFCLTGCAAPEPEPALEEEEAPLLVIDGRDLPAWRYLCWLDRCLAQGLDGEEAKAQALLDTALYAAVESMAEEQGLALTEEERSALVPGVWEEMPEEQWRALSAVGALYGKLCAVEVPEETLKAFASEQGWRTVDRILIPAGEGAADKAAEVFARLNGGGEAAFQAEKAVSADLEAPRTILPGQGLLDAALEAAAAELEEGQLSGILESEEGFSILYCLPTDTSYIRIPWLDQQLRTRAEQAEIQALSGYETLDVSARKTLVLNENVQREANASSS